MKTRLAAVEWAALAVASAIALGFLWHEWVYPSKFDAMQYAYIANDIVTNGLFARNTSADLRTYGYPWLLSLVQRGAGTLGVPLPIAVFALQFTAYVGACLYFRAALAALSVRAARIAFVAMILNFYVLIYTPQTLADSLSISLLVVAAGCCLAVVRPGSGITPWLAGSFVVGFAMMVRPANVFMLAAWIVGTALVALRRRPPPGRALAVAGCMSVALALPVLPQLANNVRHFGQWTPFVVKDLGTAQQIWGIQSIKYATGVDPVPVGAIYYTNPLYAGTDLDLKAPLRWYLEYPGRGALTIALHTFNLTDQDLLFTYSRDLHPWYRVPLGIVNHAIVALGVLGAVLLVRRLRGGRDPAARDAFAMLLVLLAANWAVYALTAVEMRFGAALLLALVPLAAFAVIEAAAMPGRRARLVVAAGTGLYVVLALLLSVWVRDQAPAIRDAALAAAPALGIGLLAWAGAVVIANA